MVEILLIGVEFDGEGVAEEFHVLELVIESAVL